MLSSHYLAMENVIIIPPSVRVFVKLNGKKESKIKNLIGVLRDYREKYTSVELQKEAMKWWRQSI